MFVVRDGVTIEFKTPPEFRPALVEFVFWMDM
jgi:hypothetical protein